MSTTIYLLSLFFLLLCSGFFSSAEVALVSISAAKVKALVGESRRGALSLAKLKERPNNFLITILVGNNIVNIMLPVISTVYFSNKYGSNILGFMTGALTILVLIFGEIVPKTFAQKHTSNVCLFAAPVVLWLTKLLCPIVWFFKLFIKTIGSDTKKSDIFSDAELVALAEIGEEEGHLEPEDLERIANVLEFSDTTVTEIMTPRTDMETFSDNISLGEAVENFLTITHTRIPVFHETKDRIIGILTLRNAMLLQEKHSKETLLSSIYNQYPLFVPTSMDLEDVFDQMKTQRIHMAIVIDEHGGTAGLVTMEDLLEEIFGEIQDETDTEIEEITKLSTDKYRVHGGTEIEDISKETGWELPGENNYAIAKIILDILGRFPEQKEEINLTENISLVVENMREFKIESVIIINNESKPDLNQEPSKQF